MPCQHIGAQKTREQRNVHLIDIGLRAEYPGLSFQMIHEMRPQFGGKTRRRVRASTVINELGQGAALLLYVSRLHAKIRCQEVCSQRPGLLASQMLQYERGQALRRNFAVIQKLQLVNLHQRNIFRRA